MFQLRRWMIRVLEEAAAAPEPIAEVGAADGAMHSGSSGPGPVPFRLRIGVTGHLQLPGTADWAEWIAEALELIVARLDPADDTSIAWSVISSLAEGADRLVAKVIMERPGSLLEVPLPLPRREYLTDFATAESKAAFAEFLEQASVIICAPRFETRAGAYEWAGQAMVGRSDVVIALWDGKPSRGVGGTADIVALARRYGRPVVHIPTEGRPEIRVLPALVEDEPSPSAVTGERVSTDPDAGPEERVSGADPFINLRRALRGLEAYNRIAIEPGRFAAASDQARKDLMGRITAPEAAALWAPIASWLIPHYAKADRLARNARIRVTWLLAVTYVFPLAAIATVAAQTLFAPTAPGLLWIEVGLLAGVFVVVAADRIAHYRPGWAEKRIWRSPLPGTAQQQWVSRRALAEQLRAAFYLAAVEPPPGRGARRDFTAAAEPLEVDASPIQGFHESAEGWLPRMYAEIWRQRPTAVHRDLQAVRQVLAEQWIRGQEIYHRDAAHRNRRDDRIAGLFVAGMFAATAAVAALHADGVGADSKPADRTLTLIAIVLPALAAAAAALTRHLEFRRHWEASESIMRRLRHAGDVVARAPSLPALRREAEAAARLMMMENRDWFALMRLHEVELHS
jgi:hypothetical protein